ncbi:MAG: threonine/serine exporter family protein [Clostridiales bacterium]|nr:threonine/serine exporter family protein [Clostridiales bacterium]
MSTKQVMQLAVLAGQIMMESGAETYRVEDTMKRIMNASTRSGEPFALPTGLFASAEDETGQVVTLVYRIKKRSLHLGKVAAVNDLSRAYVKGRLTLPEAMERLAVIEAMPRYPDAIIMAAMAVTSACFTYMFGGAAVSCAVSFLIGGALGLHVTFSQGKGLADVLVNIGGGAIIALLTLGACLVCAGARPFFDKIIIGSLMPLVPGLKFTNAVRDVIEGDFLSGASRLMDALLDAAAIAAGIGAVLSLGAYWGFSL